MQRVGRPALPLGLQKTTDLRRRHRDHKPTGSVSQQRLGAVVEAARQLDEAMTHEWRLAGQEMLASGVALTPFGHRAPDPSPRCLADDWVGYPISERITVARSARFEHRSRGVPLKEMYAPTTRAGEVRELMDEETLAGAGKSGEEHHSVAGERSDALRKPRVGLHHESRIAGTIHRPMLSLQ